MVEDVDQVIEKYLEGALALHDAAVQLTDRSRSPYGTWEGVLDQAQVDTDAHCALAELVKAISTLPKSGRSWVGERESFGSHWRDTHDSLWARSLEMNSVDDVLSRQWIRFHSFTAACFGSGMDLGVGLAFSVIVEALEKRLGKTSATIPARHCANILAAAQYFIHASACLVRYPPGRPTGYCWEDESELWKDCKGYTTERWAFWRERWELLRQNENLSDEAREAARRAEVSMGKAERQEDKKKNKNKN